MDIFESSKKTGPNLYHIRNIMIMYYDTVLGLKFCKETVNKNRRSIGFVALDRTFLKVTKAWNAMIRAKFWKLKAKSRDPDPLSSRFKIVRQKVSSSPRLDNCSGVNLTGSKKEFCWISTDSNHKRAVYGESVRSVENLDFWNAIERA